MAQGILFLIIVLFVVFYTSFSLSIPGYYKWSFGNKTKVFCPNICKTDDTEGECCSCKGKPCWELDSKLCPIGKLSVEYLDISGASVLFGSTNMSVVELIHKRGILTKIPRDICKWSSQMVTMDLRYNRLSEVYIVKCLINLDTLRLDNNLIQYIKNSTFTKMTGLRVLTLTNNLLRKLDPNTVIIERGNIPLIDFSDNRYMDSLDISNLFRTGPFCTINFTNSYVDNITNELGFHLEKVMHGPGDILLEHTHIGSFINFTSIGIEDLKQFSQYVTGHIKIDQSSINCDCTLFPVVDTFGPEIGKYWKNVDSIDGQTFECNSPEHMKGRNLTDMIETGDFEDLTCDLSEKPDCPHYLCHCIDTPSQHKVLVNCTAVGFKSMPDEMPFGVWNNYKIDLILADNEITELSDRNYFSRLVNLDLRQNDLRTFSSKAAGSISSMLNIENQLLSNLPPILQHKDPNHIIFGPHPITCDCSNTWVGDWIRLKNGYGQLNCLVNGKVMPAENVSEITLNCNNVTPLPSAAIISSIVGGITLFVVVTGVCFFFRHEVTILKRSLFRKEVAEGVYSIDVFLSFYEDNEDIFRMVSRYIKPALVNAGYTVFMPWEDITYGTQRDDELAIAVDRSLNYVIILCDKYAEDYNTISELETIWNAFLADKAKHMILINFENLDSNEIRDDRLRAMRRTRCLDFKTRHNELISRLKTKLGKPMKQKNSKDINTDNEEEIRIDNVSDFKDEENEQEEQGGAKGKEPTLSVFDRLAMPRASECNCKYRKCYLHAEPTLFKRTTTNIKTIDVAPF